MGRKKKKTENSPVSQLAGIYSPKKMKLVQQAPSSLSIGERLRRERVLRKMTMDEMAEYLGISAAYLGSVERGSRPLSNRLMKRLHDRLGTSYDYLLEGVTISGRTISHFVREAEVYTTHHNLNVLLNVCNEEELDSCYNLIHTYLAFSRDKEPGPVGFGMPALSGTGKKKKRTPPKSTENAETGTEK